MDLTLTTTIDELMKTDKINGFSHQHLFKTQPFKYIREAVIHKIFIGNKCDLEIGFLERPLTEVIQVSNNKCSKKYHRYILI